MTNITKRNTGKTRNRNGLSTPVSSLLDRFFDDSFFDDLMGSTGRSFARSTADLIEHDDSYEVRMDMPGVNREDVNVEVTDDNRLVVKAERADTKEDGSGDYLRYARKQRSYAFSVNLGNTVNTEDITATLENGVLKIDLPKPENQKSVTREIEVN